MKFLNLGLDLFLQPFILCYHYTIAVDSHWFARSNLYGEYMSMSGRLRQLCWWKGAIPFMTG